MTTPPKATSNTDFARRVGVHYTMASRLRNGRRVPSAATLTSIKRAFGIHGADSDAMMLALEEGQESFGKWLRENVFEDSEQKAPLPDPNSEGHQRSRTRTPPPKRIVLPPIDPAEVAGSLSDAAAGLLGEKDLTPAAKVEPKQGLIKPPKRARRYSEDP